MNTDLHRSLTTAGRENDGGGRRGSLWKTPALIAALLLLLPLLGSQFIEGCIWPPRAFVVLGVLLFGVEFAYHFTEAPIRQGQLENSWEGFVGETVLAEQEDARALLREAARGGEGRRGAARGGDERQARRHESRLRTVPAWEEIVAAAENLLRRKWELMVELYGNRGRDATIAVATRELGWRLVDVVRAVGLVE